MNGKRACRRSESIDRIRLHAYFISFFFQQWDKSSDDNTIFPRVFTPVSITRKPMLIAETWGEGRNIFPLWYHTVHVLVILAFRF